jgi:hypothetical protein
VAAGPGARARRLCLYSAGPRTYFLTETMANVGTIYADYCDEPARVIVARCAEGRLMG